LPKCLLRIKGKTILEYQLAALEYSGIEDVVIVIGHCGEKIKQELGDRAVFLENKDYLTTNSSYSLWLARDYMKEGFIYINADLIFSYRMIEELLISKYENAIIVDKKVNLFDDMFKTRMIENKILFMDKKVDKENCSASVIGPAKFSKKGADMLINLLDEKIQGGEYTNWCYKIFSYFAEKYEFYGVEHSGSFWEEIDMLSDIERADKNMPPDFLPVIGAYVKNKKVIV